MGIDPYAGCNPRIPNDQCTLQTCCLAQSSFLYRPDYAANLFFAIYFGVFVLPQLGLGIYYKTWGYAVGMVIGLALEVVGYAERIALHNNPFADTPFLIYLVTITIAPVFLSASIYLCLTRIIVIYGENNSRFKPRTIAIVFMTSDFTSLVLQAAGGGIADGADPGTTARKAGVDVMIAGLFLQVVSLCVFLAVGADFAWSCKKSVLDASFEKRRVRQRAFFQVFMAAVLLATITILIRSTFRVAELWEGFQGKLWNSEIDFLLLDGLMIAIAVLCVTLFHPGPAFDGQWAVADWSMKTKKSAAEKDMSLDELTPPQSR